MNDLAFNLRRSVELARINDALQSKGGFMLFRWCGYGVGIVTGPHPTADAAMAASECPWWIDVETDDNDQTLHARSEDGRWVVYPANDKWFTQQRIQRYADDDQTERWDDAQEARWEAGQI